MRPISKNYEFKIRIHFLLLWFWTILIAVPSILKFFLQRCFLCDILTFHSCLSVTFWGWFGETVSGSNKEKISKRCSFKLFLLFLQRFWRKGGGGDCCKFLAFFLAKMFGRRNVIDVLFQVVCVVNTAFERHHHPSTSPNVFLISQTFQSLDVFTFCFSLSFWGLATDYIIWSSRPLLYINQSHRLPLGILLIAKKVLWCDYSSLLKFAKPCTTYLRHIKK